MKTDLQKYRQRLFEIKQMTKKVNIYQPKLEHVDP